MLMEEKLVKCLRSRFFGNAAWTMFLVVGAVLLALCLPIVSQAANVSYKVQPGDTLTGIAARYGVTIDAIVSANALPSRTIYANQVLSIPSASAPSSQPPSPPSAQGTYAVQPGDSLSSLAQRFGISRQALASANGLSPSSMLYVGQVLKVAPAAQPTALPATPVPATPTAQIPSAAQPPIVAASTTTPQPAGSAAGAPSGKPVQYTVQPGDSLSSIAAKFNTTVDALLQLNGMSDGNYLQAGQKLTIIKGNDQNNNAPSVTSVPEPAPPMGEFGPKWVDVNLTTQSMIAYEGQTPVFTTRVSSGIVNHPTVEGTYRIYAKYESTRMTGGVGAEHYDIPNVPWTMYFYSGYALHGAFWHHNFGHPMSHGCVNLSVDDSKWMYKWAPLGTMVVTHK